MQKKLLPIMTFAKIDTRRLFRDKVAIFFVFIFPLIFLFVFGGIFGGNNGVSFNVAVVNESQSEPAANIVGAINNSKILDVDEEATIRSAATEKMDRGQVDATIVLPEAFGGVTGDSSLPSGEAQVIYNQENEQAAQALASVLEAMFDDINRELVPTETPFTVATQSTAVEGMTQFDFTFSGLLGFTILMLGIFGPTSVFPRLKQRGVLRRYQSTPLKVWQYVVGNVLSNAVVGILAVAVMFLVAMTIFNLNMRGDYLSLAVVVVIGVTMLFGIGLAVGGWAKNENQAAPFANLIAFPMMFLSGVFFPIFLMPGWLQNITEFIPLTPAVEAIRSIVTEGQTLLDVGPQIGVMLLWTAVIYAIAFKAFRWE